MADAARSPSREAYIEDPEDDSPRGRSQSRNARRRKQRKQQQQGGGGKLPAVEEAQGTAQRAITKAKGMTGAAAKPDQGGEKEDKKDALSLRLDLNLEVELTLKLKVHGDLTLAMLT